MISLFNTAEEKKKEMIRRVIQISDRHGRRLLRQHPYFEGGAAAPAGDERSTEVQRALESIAKTATPHNRAAIEEKYQNF